MIILDIYICIIGNYRWWTPGAHVIYGKREGSTRKRLIQRVGYSCSKKYREKRNARSRLAMSMARQAWSQWQEKEENARKGEELVYMRRKGARDEVGPHSGKGGEEKKKKKKREESAASSQETPWEILQRSQSPMRPAAVWENDLGAKEG